MRVVEPGQGWMLALDVARSDARDAEELETDALDHATFTVARRAGGGDVPDLTPGVPSALSPLVRRIVAPNPGPFTGPGTNTYLVGIDEVAVIDPGPDDAGHIDAIVGASMRERVRWVLLTHTHPDHSPGTARLVEGDRRRGARVREARVTRTARSSRIVSSATATTIEGTEFGLEVLHTPGHAPNHLCFLLEEERVLFTGDTVLDGMWSVVNPARGGDMAVVRADARAAQEAAPLADLCPGHGDVIEEPEAAHRRVPRAPQATVSSRF